MKAMRKQRVSLNPATIQQPQAEAHDHKEQEREQPPRDRGHPGAHIYVIYFPMCRVGWVFPRSTSCPLWVIPSRKKNRNGNERPNAILDRRFTFWLLYRVQGKKQSTSA